VTTMRQHAIDYLAMRRALGFTMVTQGRTLMSFVGDLEASGGTVLTAEAALTWATHTPGSTNPAYWASRLGTVRVFARHLKTLEPATEIPPEDVLPHRAQRITPYIYTPAETIGLLRAAGQLRPQLRAATWQAILALLMATGLRVSEACHLDRDDVDLCCGTLTVRDSKGKSREVPIHSSTTTALSDYTLVRDRFCPAPSAPAFFVCIRGTRMDASNMPRVFRGLLTAAGIRRPVGRRGPRLHDCRHSFAVATLLDWYQADADVQAQLPKLATYLGHGDPKDSYWYLTGTPELLALAAARLESTVTGEDHDG